MVFIAIFSDVKEPFAVSQMKSYIASVSVCRAVITQHRSDCANPRKPCPPSSSKQPHPSPWQVIILLKKWMARNSLGLSILSELLMAEHMNDVKSHNREKNYRIRSDSLFLRALGVSNDAGDVNPSMYSKYRQICRFVELFIERVERTQAVKQSRIKVLDIGSGKGYLTFAMYHQLFEAGLNPKIDGVDTRLEMVDLCNEAALASGFENLAFHNMKAEDFAQGYYDAIVALHACDTATDDALFYGIKSKSKLIICAPCCQNEVLLDLQKSETPNRKFISHGLLLQKQADLITDNSRVMLLRAQGYQVDVIDFVSTEHTQKNTLIAAVKKNKPSSERLSEYESYKKTFGFKGIKLEHLMRQSGLI
jgi:SAM-dependent methyltransferase